MLEEQDLITAKELFDNISAILDNYEEGGEHEAYIELRRILVLVCHEAVKDTPSAFGNLFAQVAYVCKKRPDETLRPYRRADDEIQQQQAGKTNGATTAV